MKKTTKSGGGKFPNSKPLGGPGTLPLTSALIGGISNRPSSPSSKKSGRKGSM